MWRGEVDGASYRAFRIGFGLLAALSALRFVLLGWVAERYLDPAFHFAWVSWAVVPSAPVLYGLFAVQVVAGLALAHGRWHRTAALGWLVSFGYVELLDKALYLNHYVLFTLLGLALLLIGPRRGLPRHALVSLRVLVGSVYVWAGLCKINPDWLLRAEPLRSWLAARAELPLLGPLLAWEPTAWVMSWGGMLYDLAIPFLLLFRPTWALGLALLVFFHLVVGTVFSIGIFPWLMVLAATQLLPPDWPRAWVRWDTAPGPGTTLPVPARVAGIAALALVCLFPARFLWQADDVCWDERGYRFAWRVLLIEKTGFVEYRAVERTTGRTWRVAPAAELTRLQHEQMRTQPDLIVDYGRHLAERFAAEGHDCAVYVESWASLNGRPRQRLVREDVDLTGPLPEDWIVPLVTDPS